MLLWIQRATGHFHIRFHRLSRADTSIPFNKKSFERGEHARVYESYVCSVPSPSLSPRLRSFPPRTTVALGEGVAWGRAAISPAQAGVAYPINANMRGEHEQASKNKTFLALHVKAN